MEKKENKFCYMFRLSISFCKRMVVSCSGVIEAIWAAIWPGVGVSMPMLPIGVACGVMPPPPTSGVSSHRERLRVPGVAPGVWPIGVGVDPVGVEEGVAPKPWPPFGVGVESQLLRPGVRDGVPSTPDGVASHLAAYGRCECEFFTKP